jgi:AcrR family transcriptional regulator
LCFNRCVSAEPTTRPTAEAAVLLARSWIFKGRRIDMSGLAGEVGVDRATLHRWFGTRERLIGDAIWSLVERTDDDVEPEADGRGAGRISFVVCRVVESFVGSLAIERFVSAEPKALGVLVSPQSRIMERFAERMQRLIEVEIRLGALPADLDARDASTVISRVVTSVGFADIVADQPPDLPTIDRIVKTFLQTGPDAQ